MQPEQALYLVSREIAAGLRRRPYCGDPGVERRKQWRSDRRRARREQPNSYS